MELITHQLEGLPQIVVLHDPVAFTSSFGWFVKTGARDEDAETSGVSHFLEHMVFKGTQRRSAEDVNRELDHLGAQSNAFTSEDSTVYYASVLPENQYRAVDLLSDLMQPLIPDEDFDMEKQVVLEEIAMYDDQPPYGAFERATEMFFGDHPLARRVLGTTESVADMTASQMREYHQQRYTADNMFLVASGQVDVPALLDQMMEFGEAWKAKSQAKEVAAPEFKSGSDVIERASIHQWYSVELWPGLSANDPDRYALRMLCSVLADDSGSRLFWELIDTGKAETATLWPQMFDDCGCLAGYLCCAPEDAQENHETWQRVLNSAMTEPIQEKELELARNKVTSSLILSDERPGNRLFALGQSWLTRRNYEPLEVVLGRYQDVTVEDLRRVAERTLSRDSVIVNVTGSSE